MTCNCKILKTRLERLQAKYSGLKKEHKKLLGVTMTLTDVLEEFIREGVNSQSLNTLESCSTLYPDLFGESGSKILEIPSRLNPIENSNSDGMADGSERIYVTATESEREYYEGFLARPRIPRTPQQQQQDRQQH